MLLTTEQVIELDIVSKLIQPVSILLTLIENDRSKSNISGVLRKHDITSVWQLCTLRPTYLRNSSSIYCYSCMYRDKYVDLKGLGKKRFGILTEAINLYFEGKLSPNSFPIDFDPNLITRLPKWSHFGRIHEEINKTSEEVEQEIEVLLQQVEQFSSDLPAAIRAAMAEKTALFWSIHSRLEYFERYNDFLKGLRETLVLLEQKRALLVALRHLGR